MNDADYVLRHLKWQLGKGFRLLKTAALIALCILVTACGAISGRGSGSADGVDPASTDLLCPPVGSYQHVIILGDSLMYGSTDGARTTTAQLIAAKYGLYVSNLSQSGQAISQAVRLELWRAVEFLARNCGNTENPGHQTALVVQLGHNDWLWLGMSAEAIRKSYRIFMQHVQNLEVDPYCVVPIRAAWDSLQKINGSGLVYEDVRNIVRGLAADGFCTLIETADWFGDGEVFDGRTMPDGVHLSARGHKVFTRHLMEVLKSKGQAALK